MLEFKKGVSLVTVLLFMLVATIAATATFKWLTSQNNSSAARLWQSDARQSAIAGIESARSWMTYHSNETGAVIEQFVRSNKTPVSLTLNQVLKQMDGHRFDVSVVGVDLSSSPFKVKVLSTGYGRNGSKHSEFAIFKVKGLYQIAIPTQRAPSNFHFAYYGGSPSIQQGGSAESMVVNGDLTGNEASVTDELIVTGDVTNGSNYINLADKTCIGGDLTLGNEGINNAGDLYVGGDVTGLHMWKNGNTITGDVYFNGDVTIGANGSVGNDIVGNVTINGDFTNASGKTFRIRSNMCLTDAATINFNHPTQGMFTVDGNVWIPGGGAISGVNGVDYTKVLLGSESASKVYVQNAEKCAHYYKENVDYYWGTKTLDLSTTGRFYSGESGFGYATDVTMTACPTDPYMVHQKKGAAETYPIYYGEGCSRTWGYTGWTINGECTSGEARRINNYVTFSTQGTVYGEVSGNPNFECADAIKDSCLNAFGDEVADGCDNSKYKIPDMLTTGYNSFVQKKVTCESQINAVDPNNVDYTKIEGCRTANKDNLYNGYLVIEFTDAVADKLFRNNTTQNALSGKIIFVAEQTINKITLPPTTNDAKIMFYLLKGANEVTTTNEAGPRNYFFFSYDDIKQLHANGNDRTWNGSFYMSVRDKCAKIPDISQANQRLLYNPDLVDDLIENGVLCAASVGEANCGGNQGGGEGNANGAVADGVLDGFDDKYVSTGSQLSIELESQYKNTENYPAANALNPSIVVLPRVIYLTRDAIGKLSDYYSVVNLNGANARGKATPVCQNGFPVNGTMVPDPENMLTAGFYRCRYTEGDYSSSFYVQVSGTAGEVPNIHFVGDADVNLNPTGENDMNISLFVSGVEVNQQLPISVDIRMTGDLPNGWNITMADGSDIPWKEDANGQKIYEFNSATAANDREIPVFHITTEAGAGSGSLNFFLQSPVVNAMIVNPFIKSVSITGTALIVRKSIKDYCNLNEDWCSGEYEYLKSIGDEENCDYDGVWVVANGRGCNTVEDNEKWSCYSGNSNSSPITLRSTYSDKYCEVFIPPANRGNSIVAAKDAEELPEGHVLYASLKKKRYNLHVGFSKAQSADIIVEKEEPAGVFTEIGKCSDRENGCDFRLTVDTHVRLSVDKNGENFNYWTCSGSSCGDPNRLTEKVPVTIDDDYTFIAHFNERDDHCFFTSFNNVSVFCSSMSDAPECIDKCSSQHCSLGNGVYGDSPDWLMTYTNNKKSSWAAPEIDGGYISYNGPNNGNSNNGSQSLVLNRVVAGTTGKMTARIKTGLISANKQNEFLDNGFILRSNADASEYILLNVYGKYSGNSSSGALYARLCYANGQGIPSHSACVEKQVMDAGHAASSITAQTIIALSIDLHTDPQEKHNHVHVDFKYDGSKGVVDFDLERDWSYGSLNDADHQYVGFAMTDGSFRVTDLGWKTTSFPGAVCSAYPSISCSFASKYLGGRVPANTDVGPWVGFSSWFDDKASCAANVDYYYNGCDVSTSYFYSGSGLSACAGSKEADGPSSILSPTDGLKMNSGTYNFEYEGPHGIAKSNEEIVRNAFVGVVCNDITYTSNCGSFFVGELRPCSKNLMLYNPTSSLQLSSETVVTLSSLSNVRDASLVFDFENLAEGTYVDVSLEDSHGVMTPVRTLAKGSLQFDVEAVSDVYGFNPEQLSKIHLTPSLGSYPSLKSINSSCPNAVSISCSNAKYEGSGWTISTTLTHPESAYKCSVTPSPAIDGYTATLVNCNDGIFTVSDLKFYERLNTGTSPSLSYKFTVNVFVDENADVYSTPEASCEVDSDKYDKADVSKCAIDGDKVVQGGGVPKLTFSIENCPPYGCDYEVKLSDGTVRDKNPTTIPAAGLSDEWIAPVNTTSPLDEGDYHYEVIAKNAEGALYDKCTSDNFTVIKAVPAEGECSISGDKLTLKVTGGNEQASVPVTLVYSDNIGIPIGLSTVNMNKTETETINLAEKLTTPGTYAITLRVNGNDYPCGSYSVVPGLTLSGCPTGEQEGTSVSFTPTVTGCDGNCTWSVDNGGSITPASNYTSGEVTLTGAAGTTYTLTLTRDDKSKTCSVKFKSEAEERVLTCPNAITGATAGSSNNATPVRVDGCSSSDCSYKIFVSSSEVGSGNNYNGGQVSFTGMPSPGTDPYEYTLKVTYADNESKECPFNVTYATPSSSSVASSSSAGGGCTCIAFVNGVGNYYKHCYNSGLQNMVTGKCYTMNPDRVAENPAWINEDVNQTWWWTEVSCTNWTGCSGGGGGASSSSAAPASSATPASSASGGGGGTITLTYGGDLTTITAGTYTVYSTNQWSGVMRCEADEQVTVTVDGNSKTVYTYRSSLDGANPRTNVSVTLVVPSGKTIRCNTDW